MEDLDKQILLLLQEQGRISMTDLGKTVSLSQPAVTERVRKLEEKGIINQYRAVVVNWEHLAIQPHSSCYPLHSSTNQ
ncbi:winged helix-turn-helix DNA-binding protein [Paenibacillus taihuensis]|uniref:Winged helix-turn-helix DNA-binding protein n=1 Tax=Paenibacillus taihuensis TaxID=1156355 RepID=A0A3D9SDA0_9BACL|nr:winged helix-turn-helix DNA-binding protein [Paenibacillus taihuensis]